MSQTVTTTNDQGQLVSEVLGQPGRTITGRPTNVEIDNPVTRDPFAGIPGAYGDDEEQVRRG